MDLTGKWKYIENYGYGVAEGELYLKQEGVRLSGRIVFSDKLEGEEPYMIQEFLTGSIKERKIRLDATEFDIIHSNFNVTYELDRWFGILVDERTIKGVSVDDQGVEGHFEFEMMDKVMLVEI
ncbi:MAG: hypothetical protein RR397_06430 [Odoribacter sp.]